MIESMHFNPCKGHLLSPARKAHFFMTLFIASLLALILQNFNYQIGLQGRYIEIIDSISMYVSLSFGSYIIFCLIILLIFNNSFNKKFIKSHRLENICNKNLIIVFSSSWDDNNNLKLTLAHDISYFKELEKMGYTIAMCELEKPQDIKNKIEQAKRSNNKIQALWFRSHGEPKGLILSQNKLNPSPEIWLREQDLPDLAPSFNELEQSAPIIRH